MADAMRAMLDSLMGKHRNEALDAKKLTVEEYRRSRLADTDICKDYLCGYCPNELFINTKVTLGRCDLVHDEALMEEWSKLSEREQRKYGYYDQVWSTYLPFHGATHMQS